MGVKNVLGEDLKVCSCEPMTGFFRDGSCHTGGGDYGSHTICVEVDADFLDFSHARGNDLSTPRPSLNFPGLKPGDHWCICANRWQEAFESGVAPKVDLAATHIMALEFVNLSDLKAHALK